MRTSILAARAVAGVVIKVRETMQFGMRENPERYDKLDYDNDNDNESDRVSLVLDLLLTAHGAQGHQQLRAGQAPVLPDQCLGLLEGQGLAQDAVSSR